MVAPCGCGVLLDTEGKNPTSISGCVKPDFGVEQVWSEAEIPLCARPWSE
jgi:hypothetical protein